MAQRIAILTGANRGLGRTTAEILVQKYANNFQYIFTERSKNHDELTQALKSINPNAQFEVRDLDISSKESRAQFKQWFSQKYHKIDVLFNNAGVFDQDKDTGARPSKETAEYTLNINFINTVEFTEELYPLMTDDGKIVVISSFLGKLEHQPEAAKQILVNENLTKEKLFELAHNYINNAGTPDKDLIFNNYVYFTSKALLNAYTRYVATKYIKPNQSFFAVHPGWVQTDMGGKKAPLTKDYACPFLANIIAEFPFGKHPLSGLLQFENKQLEY
ncbi:oxidoreductase, short chain dehydrogenase/reductase family protein (macronuclear) [Tetrahymena thermophila SB210]|uniref:Oxidoreductase, short chain dehydrogenase/reductase family protein n=1 Tax=Tetrahymena thermophila (strain SB210) TaxID=312017 RepID=Q22SZ1_TETTS|nr:oxidoreductase, short chain dehydrogenase/reductase family protein [Tetrahymena thermophila SB210]EAR88647.1 oxidoreductase, short chain dehydrogenase/reductase family protein [Tetrahymena thermophila SB210]|eukprot:XP_001008892.1 oxidoreductase, short chain dehydrogenase/reductase family protein [Tetrahymena thermophila SB210]